MLRMIAAAGVAVMAAGLIACGERPTEADVDAMVETRVAEALAPPATPPPIATHSPSPTPTVTPPPIATHTPSPAPTATPIPTGRIAFVSDNPEDGNFGIYVMDEDDSDALYTVRQIQDPPRQTLTLVLRPHGGMALQAT